MSAGLSLEWIDSIDSASSSTSCWKWRHLILMCLVLGQILLLMLCCCLQIYVSSKIIRKNRFLIAKGGGVPSVAWCCHFALLGHSRHYFSHHSFTLRRLPDGSPPFLFEPDFLLFGGSPLLFSPPIAGVKGHVAPGTDSDDDPSFCKIVVHPLRHDHQLCWTGHCRLPVLLAAACAPSCCLQ